MTMNSLDPIQRLAVIQAMEEVIRHEVNPKEDGLRASVNADILDEYGERGIKSRDILINGQKVGSITVTVSKQKTNSRPEVADAKEFYKWLDENKEHMVDFVTYRMDEFAKFHLDTTGELPGGCEMRTTITPGHASGTMLKVDAQKTFDALGTSLPSAVTGLLGAGDGR